jgi:hypothetical protein
MVMTHVRVCLNVWRDYNDYSESGWSEYFGQKIQVSQQIKVRLIVNEPDFSFSDKNCQDSCSQII